MWNARNNLPHAMLLYVPSVFGLAAPPITLPQETVVALLEARCDPNPELAGQTAQC